ncbi:long-chain fatty acid--CoA ligase, partial [Streptomyces albidoflavus]
LLTLEPEGIAHWRKMRKKEALTTEKLVADPELLEALQKAVDDANKLVSRAESIRRFTVLPVDFTEEAGHLTPSLKIKRPAVEKDFAEEIEAMYRK